MERNQDGGRWWGKALVYALSSALAGLTLGTALGAAGSGLSSAGRIAAASALALVAIAVGSSELVGHPIWLPQRDRETPQRWIHAGALRWAIRNGATLGVGATSRIGFWLWYAIPVGAILLARPEAGAAIYGTYGATRGLAAWGVLLGLQRLIGPEWAHWLLTHKPAARRIAASQLIALGTAVAVTVGW